MNPKAWYLSKVLWVNLIGVAAIVIQGINANFVIGPDYQGLILGLVNLILRTVTSAPLDWSAPSDPSGQNRTGQGQAIGTGLDTHGFIQLPLLLMIISLLAAGLMVNGCATTAPATPAATVAAAPGDTPLVLAGKSLMAVKSTIVTAATATDALCKAGTIGPDKCEQARLAYAASRPAYDTALDAYLLMSLGYATPEAFGTALTKVQTIAANLLAISSLSGVEGGAK